MSRQIELGTELTEDEVEYLRARGRDEFIVENDRVLAEQQGQREADAAAKQAAAEAEAAKEAEAKKAATSTAKDTKKS